MTEGDKIAAAILAAKSTEPNTGSDTYLQVYYGLLQKIAARNGGVAAKRSMAVSELLTRKELAEMSRLCAKIGEGGKGSLTRTEHQRLNTLVEMGASGMS